MKRRMQRICRSRPGLEGLEGRLLLATNLHQVTQALSPLELSQFRARNPSFTPPKETQNRVAYTTPQGTQVIVTLYGPGTLAHTTVDADGVLDLVYAGTDATSGIIGRVVGGSGQAQLRSIQDADTALRDFSGSGATPVGIVNLKDFNLVDGGIVNLTGEVGKLFLRSVGANSEVQLKEIPQPSTTTTTTTTGTSVSTEEVLSTPTATTAGVGVSSAGALTTTTTTSTASTSSAGTTSGTSTSSGASTSSGTSISPGAAITAGTAITPGTGLGGGAVGTTGVGATAIGVGGGVGTFGGGGGVNAVGLGGGGGGASSLSGTSFGSGANPGSAAPAGGAAGPVSLRAVVSGSAVGGTASFGGGGFVGGSAAGGGGGGGAAPAITPISGTSVNTPAPAASTTAGGTSTVGGATGGGVRPIAASSSGGGTTTTGGSTGSTTAITGVVTTGGGATTTNNGLGSATGIDVVISHVNGDGQQTPLGDPQFFGYDPTANALIRFDALTGAQEMTIPLPGTGAPAAAVSLARDAGQLVVLAAAGTTVLAFDAVTGAPVGQFSTANLASLGLASIDGIATTGTRTILADSTAGTAGLALEIDVTDSLSTHQAVPVVAPGQAPTPFGPTKEFTLSGGLTGVAGSDTLYAVGSAFFDTTQPNLTQLGVMTISTSDNGKMAETSRAPFTTPPQIVNVGPLGTIPAFKALGSVDQRLALIIDGTNDVALYNRNTLAATALVHLQDANPVGSSRVDLQACKLEYSIVSPK